jgi:hypothetical protein
MRSSANWLSAFLPFEEQETAVSNVNMKISVLCMFIFIYYLQVIIDGKKNALKIN